MNEKKKTNWMQVIVMLVGAISPAATGLATYTTASKSLDAQFIQLKLDTQQHFAGKEDVQQLTQAMSELTQEVSYLRGLLHERDLARSRKLKRDLEE